MRTEYNLSWDYDHYIAYVMFSIVDDNNVDLYSQNKWPYYYPDDSISNLRSGSYVLNSSNAVETINWHVRGAAYSADGTYLKDIPISDITVSSSETRITARIDLRYSYYNPVLKTTDQSTIYTFWHDYWDEIYTYFAQPYWPYTIDDVSTYYLARPSSTGEVSKRLNIGTQINMSDAPQYLHSVISSTGLLSNRHWWNGRLIIPSYKKCVVQKIAPTEFYDSNGRIIRASNNVITTAGTYTIYPHFGTDSPYNNIIKVNLEVFPVAANTQTELWSGEAWVALGKYQTAYQQPRTTLSGTYYSQYEYTALPIVDSTLKNYLNAPDMRSQIILRCSITDTTIWDNETTITYPRFISLNGTNEIRWFEKSSSTENITCDTRVVYNNESRNSDTFPYIVKFNWGNDYKMAIRLVNSSLYNDYIFMIEPFSSEYPAPNEGGSKQLTIYGIDIIPTVGTGYIM